MAGVDETHDRQPAVGLAFQVLEKLPGIAPGADQDDPVASESPDPFLLFPPRRLQGIFHE